MKTTYKILTSAFASGFAATALIMGLFAVSYQPVSAATPILSLVANSGNYVQIQVNGDANASVQLMYYPTGSGYATSAGVIGTTNSAGIFTTTVPHGSYGILSGNTTYVLVNGLQSSSVSWPTGANGYMYFSQPSLSVSIGQTASSQINGGSGSYYVSSNSNSAIATANIIGSTITVTGAAQGTTSFTICSYVSSGGCATLTVTVNGSWWGGSSNQISLSQNALTLQQGQAQNVTIYGSASSYYISNNPGSNTASASITGNTIQVNAQNPGSVSYSICASSGSTSCTSLMVTVTSYYGYNNGSTWYGSGYNYNNYYGSNYYGNTGYYPNQYYQYTYTQPSYVQPTYTPTYAQPTYVYTQPTYTQQVGQPVSGVFLNQVPSTGIGFGLKMTLFVLSMGIWSLFAAYVLTKTYGKKHAGFASMTGGAAAAGITSAQPFRSATQSLAAQFKELQRRKKGF